MTKYKVKHTSIMLPMTAPDQTGRVVLKDQVVDLDDKLGEHFLKYGAVEAVADTKKAETKSADEKPATTRGRGAAKPADS